MITCWVWSSGEASSRCIRVQIPPQTIGMLTGALRAYWLPGDACGVFVLPCGSLFEWRFLDGELFGSRPSECSTSPRGTSATTTAAPDKIGTADCPRNATRLVGVGHQYRWNRYAARCPRFPLCSWDGNIQITIMIAQLNNCVNSRILEQEHRIG